MSKFVVETASGASPHDWHEVDKFDSLPSARYVIEYILFDRMVKDSLRESYNRAWLGLMERANGMHPGDLLEFGDFVVRLRNDDSVKE